MVMRVRSRPIEFLRTLQTLNPLCNGFGAGNLVLWTCSDVDGEISPDSFYLFIYFNISQFLNTSFPEAKSDSDSSSSIVVGGASLFIGCMPCISFSIG